MTIGKKLYIGFGTILGVLSLLILVNIVVGSLDLFESLSRVD